MLASSSADVAVVDRGCQRPHPYHLLQCCTHLRAINKTIKKQLRYQPTTTYPSSRDPDTPCAEGVPSRIGGRTTTWEALSDLESLSTEETPRDSGGASSEEVQLGLHNLRMSSAFSLGSRALRDRRGTTGWQ
ncbi:hypothetical protein Pcinc_026234 [Petrolisthes cinctipes]|uniref:Uncharacterized protein n=1 Tax=Petrolisthes cinctipes TaxID=88211 RepID=A0AAE1F6X3_PETCI|nr:hypothetical protein Pcinc_026234 [Petrolisthes cinctipes]